MKIILALFVVSTLLTSASADDPFAAFAALDAEYTLGEPDCVFDFGSLVGAEVTCTTNITAPETAETLSYVEGGDCEEIPTPALHSSINATDTTSEVVEGNVLTYANFIKIPDAAPNASAIVNFCITTELWLGDPDDIASLMMYYTKTPIETVFKYDGSFEVSAGVSLNDAVGETIGNEVTFRAYAYICELSEYAVETDPLEIGSILYICVKPWDNQTTTVLEEVLDLEITKPEVESTVDVNGDPVAAVDALSMNAVTNKVTNPVTAVTGKNSRLIIIGIRVPAPFFDTGANIEGNGEVLIVQSRRLLRAGVDNGRGLEEAEAVIDGAFDLNVGITAKEPLSGSALSNTSTRMSFSMAAVIFGALYCF